MQVFVSLAIKINFKIKNGAKMNKIVYNPSLLNLGGINENI